MWRFVLVWAQIILWILGIKDLPMILWIYCFFESSSVSMASLMLETRSLLHLHCLETEMITFYCRDKHLSFLAFLVMKLEGMFISKCLELYLNEVKKKKFLKLKLKKKKSLKLCFHPYMVTFNTVCTIWMSYQTLLCINIGLFFSPFLCCWCQDCRKCRGGGNWSPTRRPCSSCIHRRVQGMSSLSFRGKQYVWPPPDQYWQGCYD